VSWAEELPTDIGDDPTWPEENKNKMLTEVLIGS
jgi:hypothetical protein